MSTQAEWDSSVEKASKFGFYLGLIIGPIVGFHFAGIGGAIVGLIVGGIAGWLALLILASAWSLIFLIIAIVLGLAVGIYLIGAISSLWNVGKP